MYSNRWYAFYISQHGTISFYGGATIWYYSGPYSVQK